MRAPLLLFVIVAAAALFAAGAIGAHELSALIGRAFENFSVTQ